MNPPQKQYSRTYKKRQYPAKAMSIDDKIRLAVQAESRKTIRKMESKSFDVALQSGAIDYNGSTYSLLAQITQGISDSQYIGASIMPTTVRFRWAVTCADSTQLLRCVVIQTIGGGVPTATTVFQSTVNVRAPLSAFDRNYHKTYKVLSDELYSLVSGTSTTIVTGDVRIPHTKLREVSFTDASGTVEANGIYALFISDSSAVSHPILQGYSRVYFKDV